MFVVFDLDGTLIDSTAVMTEAFQYAYEAVGLKGTAPQSILQAMQGSPFPAILRAAGLPAEMHGHFKQASTSLMSRIALHVEAIECCARLVDEGAIAAVFTGKDRVRTEAILSYFGITDLFSHLVASDDGIAGKPSPAGIDYLLQASGRSKHETIMVGDAANDVLSARAAGVSSVGVLWGTQSEASLVRSGADCIVETPNHLYDALTYVGQPAQNLAS